MDAPDFTVPAAVYVQVLGAGRSTRGRAPQKYHRFGTLALAVQFAIEKSHAELVTVKIETDNGDYTGSTLRSLYDDDRYPLPRNPAAEVGEQAGQSAKRTPE